MDEVQVLPNSTLWLIFPLRVPLISFSWHIQNQSMNIHTCESDNEKEVFKLPRTTSG